jgi:hypothetical protein
MIIFCFKNTFCIDVFKIDNLAGWKSGRPGRLSDFENSKPSGCQCNQ